MRRILSRIHIICDFIKFFISAKTIDQIDSPFYFEFHQRVIKSYQSYNDKSISLYREALKSDQTIVKVGNVGAKSQITKKNKVSVSHISQNAVSKDFKCKLLLFIVNFFKSQTILELGTSLGVSTLYLAKADNLKKIISVEGEMDIYRYIQNKVADGKLTLLNSTFTDFFVKAINDSELYDCIVIDGDHTYNATIDNFNQSRKILSENGIIILDDIYWSKGMKNAWKYIQNEHHEFHTINLFFYGIVFKNARLKKLQRINITPFPIRWKLGLFRR